MFHFGRLPMLAWMLAISLGAGAQPAEPGKTQPETPPAATAEECEDWQFKVIPFVWVPATDINVSYGSRDLGTTISPSQTVSKLQFALAGAVAAQKGEWGVMGEGLYTNLANDVQYRNVTGSLRSNQTLLQASGSYRLVEDEGLSLDAVAGLRFYDFGFTNSFTRDGVVFTQNYDAHRSKSWVDPLVGLRANIPLNSELSLNIYGDVGGFGVGSDFSWRAQAVFGYSLSECVDVNLGYAALGARLSQGVGADSLKFDFKNYGPVIGATFKI
ncbi:hypothetical protein IV102_13995 [bacterium]|nr:hypothetical protein [bacterium]